MNYHCPTPQLGRPGLREGSQAGFRKPPGGLRNQPCGQMSDSGQPGMGTVSLPAGGQHGVRGMWQPASQSGMAQQWLAGWEACFSILCLLDWVTAGLLHLSQLKSKHLFCLLLVQSVQFREICEDSVDSALSFWTVCT